MKYDPFVYVATFRCCGGCFMMSCDIPEHAEDVAASVSDAILSGGIVNRVSLQEARLLNLSYHVDGCSEREAGNQVKRYSKALKFLVLE